MGSKKSTKPRETKTTTRTAKPESAGEVSDKMGDEAKRAEQKNRIKEITANNLRLMGERNMCTKLIASFEAEIKHIDAVIANNNAELYDLVGGE